MFNLICRKHILSAKESLNTRRVGWVENIYWKTNEVPEVFAFKSTCSSKPGEMIADFAGRMMPYLLMLMDECMRAADDHWPKELLSLVEKKHQTYTET